MEFKTFACNCVYLSTYESEGEWERESVNETDHLNKLESFCSNVKHTGFNIQQNDTIINLLESEWRGW